MNSIFGVLYSSKFRFILNAFHRAHVRGEENKESVKAGENPLICRESGVRGGLAVSTLKPKF
jgi:hypothetical protein